MLYMYLSKWITLKTGLTHFHYWILWTILPFWMVRLVPVLLITVYLLHLVSITYRGAALNHHFTQAGLQFQFMFTMCFHYNDISECLLWVQGPISVLLCLSQELYSAASLYGQFSPKSLQKTPHRSPMRLRYGVSVVILKSYSLSANVFLSAICKIMINWTELKCYLIVFCYHLRHGEGYVFIVVRCSVCLSVCLSVC